LKSCEGRDQILEQVGVAAIDGKAFDPFAHARFDNSPSRRQRSREHRVAVEGFRKGRGRGRRDSSDAAKVSQQALRAAQ
jgi:hypothetical protein